jgi:hypothetical protein
MADDQLCRVARRNRQRRRATFKRRHLFFQHRLGGVHDAGVDVAERAQCKQISCVLGIVEHKRRGLIDRRGARAGGRVGLCAGMNGKGVEIQVYVIAHLG